MGVHITLPDFLAGGPGHMPGESSAAPQLIFPAQKLNPLCAG